MLKCLLVAFANVIDCCRVVTYSFSFWLILFDLVFVHPCLWYRDCLLSNLSLLGSIFVAGWPTFEWAWIKRMDNSETLNPTTGKREWCLVSCRLCCCLCRLLSLGQCGSLRLWFLFASVLEGLASVGSGSLVRFTPPKKSQSQTNKINF